MVGLACENSCGVVQLRGFTVQEEVIIRMMLLCGRFIIKIKEFRTSDLTTVKEYRSLCI